MDRDAHHCIELRSLALSCLSAQSVSMSHRRYHVHKMALNLIPTKQDLEGTTLDLFSYQQVYQYFVSVVACGPVQSCAKKDQKPKQDQV